MVCVLYLNFSATTIRKSCPLWQRAWRWESKKRVWSSLKPSDHFNHFSYVQTRVRLNALKERVSKKVHTLFTFEMQPLGSGINNFAIRRDWASHGVYELTEVCFFHVSAFRQCDQHHQPELKLLKILKFGTEKIWIQLRFFKPPNLQGTHGLKGVTAINSEVWTKANR